MNTFTSLDSGVVARAKKQGLMGREQISLFLYNNPTTPPAPHSMIPQLTALKKGATPGETKFLGGSAPNSKLLPFYTPFLTEKVRGLSFISAWRGGGVGKITWSVFQFISQPPPPPLHHLPTLSCQQTWVSVTSVTARPQCVTIRALLIYLSFI